MRHVLFMSLVADGGKIMDGWILLNFLCALIALIANLYRFKPNNPRRWLRLPAAMIALYIGAIYFLSLIGVVPETEIRFFMSWFQAGIMIYLTVEALNG